MKKSSGTTTLTIDFPADESKKSRVCTVMLDGKTLGKIGAGERRNFGITAGKHKLFITRKSYSSVEFDFQAQADKEVFLEIRFEPMEIYPKQFAVLQHDMNFIDNSHPHFKRA